MLEHIVLRLNTFMKTQHKKIDQAWGVFFADHVGDRSVCIEIDLNINHIPYQQREDEAAKIARKFRNSLSRFYYGNEARTKKRFAAVVIHIHKKKKTDTGSFWHLHIIAEVPEEFSFQSVKDFTNLFVIRNFPVVKPRERDICYFELTRNVIGAAIYDGKYGSDSIYVF